MVSSGWLYQSERREGRGARRCLAPTLVGRAFPVGHRRTTVRWCTRRPVGGQAVPDRAAQEGRGMAPSPGYGWRSRRVWAPAVRPGLKPRAESPSPLKGAVRRPGARVDRLGAGAGGISRLQPAWGLSPAVHGRAIVERAARLTAWGSVPGTRQLTGVGARRPNSPAAPRPRHIPVAHVSRVHDPVGTATIAPSGDCRPCGSAGQAPPDPYRTGVSAPPWHPYARPGTGCPTLSGRGAASPAAPLARQPSWQHPSPRPLRTPPLTSGRTASSGPASRRAR